jgi:hypothetical protein
MGLDLVVFDINKILLVFGTYMNTMIKRRRIREAEEAAAKKQ